MNTLETAKQTKTAYFIEYVNTIDAYGKQSFYFQLYEPKIVRYYTPMKI